MENEKKITRRIGSFTFGIMMILIGVNILLQTITSLELFRFTLSLWPIVFILLGIETLYFSYRKDVEIKYDILSIITIFIVLFLGMIFSTLNYGVNKVLYNKDIRTDIICCLTDSDYNINFKDKVNINSMSQDNVTVKFIEDKEADEVFVRVIYEFKEPYEGSILKALRNRNLLYSTFNIDYNEQKMTVENMPDFVNSINIIVTANDKSKLEYGGVVIN
jgi:hypothetical protein